EVALFQQVNADAHLELCGEPLQALPVGRLDRVGDEDQLDAVLGIAGEQRVRGYAGVGNVIAVGAEDDVAAAGLRHALRLQAPAILPRRLSSARISSAAVSGVSVEVSRWISAA